MYERTNVSSVVCLVLSFIFGIYARIKKAHNKKLNGNKAEWGRSRTQESRRWCECDSDSNNNKYNSKQQKSWPTESRKKMNMTGKKRRRKKREWERGDRSAAVTVSHSLFLLSIWYCTYSKFFSSYFFDYNICIYLLLLLFHMKILPAHKYKSVCAYAILIHWIQYIHSWHTRIQSKIRFQPFVGIEFTYCTQLPC